MHQKLRIVLSIIIILIGSLKAVWAQKPVKPALPAAAKNKKPLVKSSLGSATGIVKLSADEIRQLITMPLKITDIKNVEFEISSYQLAYKRMEISEDEETGKSFAQSNVVANRFTTTPLPAVWQKNIINGIHKGEELYFFDIIVFDKKGLRFFAPDLKIEVQ